MKQRRIALGPGAASLILIIVILSMSMLTVLNCIAARNDERLSLRSTEMTGDVYTLSVMSEETLALLDDAVVVCMQSGITDRESFLQALEEALPEKLFLDGDYVSWTETLGERSMACRVLVLPENRTEREIWVTHRLIGTDTEVSFDD